MKCLLLKQTKKHCRQNQNEEEVERMKEEEKNQESKDLFGV